MTDTLMQLFHGAFAIAVYLGIGALCLRPFS